MTEYNVVITMLTGASHSLKTTDLDAANAFIDTYAIPGATSKVVITATTISEAKEIFRKLMVKDGPNSSIVPPKSPVVPNLGEKK